jgi:hypothetical protein
MDVLFELHRSPKDVGLPWLGFNLILLKRLLESGFISVHELGGGVMLGPLKTTPDLIAITDKGGQFVDELGIVTL